MTTISGRMARAAGEGALAGWIGGAAVGAWAVLLNRDLPLGMIRLAVDRLAPHAAAGALLGALGALAAEILLLLASRAGRRGLLIGTVALSLLYLAAAGLAAGPYRATLFPLRIFSSHLLSLGVFGVIAGAQGWMLLERFRSAWRFAGAAAPGVPPSRSRAAWSGASLAALAALVIAALPWIPALHPGNGTSVILLSLDTLRADRVDALGCPRGLTPRLDSLAGEGTVFEQADSAAPWTLPSHASLFSSLLPYDHWARWEHHPLPPGIATLAEHFREAGYRTASFNGGGYVSAYLGLAQGFQIYQEHDEEKEGGGGRIAAAALKWARRNRDRPFFLFVHTYEIHSPYTHSDKANPADAGRLSGVFSTQDVLAAQRGELVLTPRERRYVSELYDGDVAEADRVMGGMLETMKKEGILDRTLLVILSDHGEDLWDHDATRSPGHGHSLYEELLHVPLIFRWPGKVRRGGRLKTPVSLLDVAPTLLAMTGLPPDPRQQGRSLARSLRDGTEPPPEPVMAESIEYGPDRFSLRKGSMKVILTPDPEQANAGVHVAARPLEVFDLASDPGERSSLSAPLPAEARDMVEIVWRRVEKVFRPLRENPGGQKIPEELQEQLRSLGYVH